MSDQLVRNILHDEQVLYMPALSIQVYHELRAVWSIPDLSMRLEARSQEVYEIIRQKNLELEGSRSKSRNAILLVISFLTVFQLTWTLWSFTFDRTKKDSILRGPGLTWSIVSATMIVALVTVILVQFARNAFSNRRNKMFAQYLT